MIDKIKQVIKEYKADFQRIDADERYKWEAVKSYKDNWNIEAEDFADMYAEAFKKSGNLLAANMYFPYKMAIQFAEEKPETVRSLFKMLYDESIPLAKRYIDFRAGFDEYVKPKNINHYQDLHAISVYLTFEYPDKYYVYKYRTYKSFKDYIGFSESIDIPKSEVYKLEVYMEMCSVVLDEIEKDNELLTLSNSRLSDDCYPDTAHHLLTFDVIRIGGEIGKENNEKSSNVSPMYEEGNKMKSEMKNTDISKNTILYGPPGTGKTYNTVVYAVAIIENKLLQDIKKEPYGDVLERYNQYKSDGLIEFTTFHQSYGYEEFIEGIKPVMENNDEEQTDIQYQISSGLFKTFCEKAGRPIIKQSQKDIGLNASPSVWKVSLEGTGENPTRTECLTNGHIRVGYDSYGKDITSETNFDNGGKNVINAFIYKMQIGDIVLSCYSATTIDAIGVVTGEYEWHDEYSQYKRLRKVNWLVKGIRQDITEINNGSALTLSSVYKLNVSLSDVMDIISENAPTVTEVEDKKKNYVFVIDEINRGNISKIFGELITLIETSKRLGQSEGMRAKLPYSQKLFGVPDNVFIIGTMNTADRSIATIDTALRRRFRFKEMMPDSNVLKGVNVEDISIADMLTRMNKRIAVLYDREHTIGHAYFVTLIDNPTIEQLAEIFENSIVPLLQEYFYEDYEKIRLVLGDNNKTTKEEQFIVVVENDYNELFGSTDVGFDDSVTYEINKAAFDNIEAYRSIQI